MNESKLLCLVMLDRGATVLSTSRRPSVSPRLSQMLVYVVFAVVMLAFPIHAHALPLIDSFDNPDIPDDFVIDFLNPNPTLLKHATGIGGERDILINVLGAPGLVSAAGTIGAGSLEVGTTGAPPTTVILQYDGVDADTPSSLINAHGLNINLESPYPSFIRLSFRSVDAAAANGLQLRVTMTSAGATAEFSDLVSPFPQAYSIPFSSFSTVGPFNLAAVTSLEFAFNENAIRDVDFTLDSIEVFRLPEPDSLVLLVGSTLAGMAWLYRCRSALPCGQEAIREDRLGFRLSDLHSRRIAAR